MRSFITSRFIKYFYGTIMKDDEMGGVYSTNEVNEKRLKILIGESKGKIDNLEDLGVD
jgi:hypothetical protein